ncbi:uncharacterized protein C8Q71DRAFT_27674 [Rhodofomes roseus]|uniref:Uncharacterized protein n=1 Tax=Rhodofomes roseus TaxID=34475 RepID=A0ABQ8KXM1_9APHY|nr:uncharacterized protein C8Q71DRAFT_27674 [Rhodofomes roseus]KAH9844052.1 hypothetical protein C8Q71DRAFT_27674 [Rhodofomes roseus]
MATTLPSFVELMATLGLENTPGLPALHKDAVPVQVGHRVHHSRSSSASSSSSLSSSFSNTVSPRRPLIRLEGSSATERGNSPSDRDLDAERRRVRAPRFTPYAPCISHMRKRSAPIFIKEEMEEAPVRPLSTSPYLSPTVPRRASHNALRQSYGRPRKLVLSQSDLTANTPISTFVRRKTPQASPTSPSFSHRIRKRSCSPVQPVSIPTLPHVFPPPETWKYASSDTDDEDMHDA